MRLESQPIECRASYGTICLTLYFNSCFEIQPNKTSNRIKMFSGQIDLKKLNDCKRKKYQSEFTSTVFQPVKLHKM